MACEKYLHLMIDAALGGSNPKREAELLQHLSHCASCRDEFNHTRAAFAAVDRAVEELVEGEPSPQFTTRLRARIANEHAPARPEWRAWISVAAGAMALAAILIVVMMSTPRQVTRGMAQVVQSTSIPTAEVPTNAERRASGASQMLNRPRYRAAKTLQPEVIVPPEQVIAVMQFANAVYAKRIDGEQIVTAQEQSKKPLDIEAIQISPLSIPLLDNASGDPENPGGY
jgi:hypothetical protein